MPDAAGNIKGIALSGRAGEVLEKIKQRATLCEECDKPATHQINGMDVCEDCWERGMGLD